MSKALRLPTDVERRVTALADATGNGAAEVLARLVEYALGHGDGLAAGAELPREIVLVKLHDYAHGAGAEGGFAAAILDELDASEFDYVETIAEELPELLAEDEQNEQGRAKLVAYIKAQLVRDFSGDASA